MKNKITTQLVYTALFAAIIFLGTKLLRIQLAPKTMIHVGNALVVVSFFALKTRHAMIAATVGFGIFDATSNYISSLPFTILESVLVILICHFVYKALQNKDTLFNIILVSFIAAISKVIIIFIKKVITNMLVTGATTAIPLATATMYNSIITAIFTLILAPMIYFQLKPLIQKINQNF